MTYRELLELAAKAYWGNEIDDVVSLEWSDADNSILYTHADNQDHNGQDRTYRWNPLAEDADALQLAVKLRMQINLADYGAAARVATGRWYGYEEYIDGGIEAATRRAIVRAAAEIGRSTVGASCNGPSDTTGD